MAVPAYIPASGNLALDAAVTGANLHDSANYPASYVADGILGKPSYHAYTGGAFDFVIDTPMSYDTMFIGNHDLTAAATIEVKADTSTSFGNTLTAGATWRSRDMWIALGTQSTYNYVRYNTADTRTTPIKVGEIVIGLRVALPRLPMWGVQKSQRNTGITCETLGGVQYDYELSKHNIYQPTFRFPESEYASFLAFSDAVGRDPFVYIPDNTAAECYYMRKERGFDARVAGVARDGSSLAQWYDWSPIFRTESAGLEVAG